MSESINRAEVLAHAREIEALCKEAILATVPRNTEPAQIGCAIVGSIFDGYRAVLALLGTDGEWHSPTLARTMFEAFADLRALANDAGYVERMKLHAANERKRVVADYVRSYGEMEEFKTTAERARSDLADLERIIAGLRDVGVADYNVAERFRLAGLGGDRVYVYGELSSFAHSDFIALMLRHVDGDSIVLGPRLPDEWFSKAIFLTSTIVLDGLLMLPSFTTVNEDQLNALRDKAIEHYHHLPFVPKIAPNASQS
jgi:hypothetical protein